MANTLTYEERLRKAENTELTRIKRQEKAEEKKREREIRRQERLVNIAIKKHQQKIENEAFRRATKKKSKRSKTKKMVKMAWRKLI